MTLAELTNQVAASKNRRTVLTYLIEHLEGEFMSDAAEKPRKALLTEDKVRVPTDAIEEVLSELATAVKTLVQDEQKLLSSEVALTPPSAEVTPTQGEAQS